jgi:hypothetical protein
MPITAQGWLLNGLPFNPATPMTAADNGKTLTYFAQNNCETQTSNGISITVNTLVPQDSVANVCNADFPYRYTDSAFGVDTVFNANAINNPYRFYSGCNVRVLTVNVLEAVNSKQPQIPQICADDGYFYIEVEPTGAAGDVPASVYTVEFSANSGISTPQTGSVETGNKIRVDIPSNIYPDIYYCKKIILTNPASCSDKIFENVQFEVYYPSNIMQQKWDDVIALKNAYYNGGYDFAAYEWYKNGSSTGETRSYIYLNGQKLDPNDEYSVKLTRTDGSTMFSCPLNPSAPKTPLSAFPTIVSGDNSITIYLTKDNSTVRLWTTTGILLQTAKPKSPAKEISFSAQQGAYLVEVFYGENGSRAVQAVVVR